MGAGTIAYLHNFPPPTGSLLQTPYAGGSGCGQPSLSLMAILMPCW